MPRCLTWLIAALPLVAMAQPAQAPALSSISGEIRYANGQSASKAYLWWESASGIGRSGGVEADAAGHFELTLTPRVVPSLCRALRRPPG
jgi:hypothetical protein